MVTSSDTSCNRVTSSDECEAAARELGLADTSAHIEDMPSYMPPNCFYHDGLSGYHLYYNTGSSSNAACSSTIKCICKIENVATTKLPGILITF